jgi:hypothetical protein
VYPRILSVETNPGTGVAYVVGDVVAQFAPLVTGASVTDWVKDPKWFQGIVNQGAFYEVQKYHTFLVRVDSQAFNLASLMFAQKFLAKIKPIYTDPLYVVALPAGPDEIDVVDSTSFALTMRLYDTPCDRMGASYYFDEPWAAGAEALTMPGGAERSYRNNFDRGDDPTAPVPDYPGPSDLVAWGFDKEWLCPADRLELSRSEVYAPSALPRYDSVFAFDMQVTQQVFTTLSPPSSYGAFLTLFTADRAATITRFQLQLNGPTLGALGAHWGADLLVNGTVRQTHAFDVGYVHPVLGLVITMPQNIELIVPALSIAISIGDVVSLHIYPTSLVTQTPGWTQILAATSLGEGPWGWDAPLAGGTYYNVGELE